MSNHFAFRRVPVQQGAQQYAPVNLPAPTRGIIEDENYAFMQPGGAIIQDNWMPTLRGVSLRSGYVRWIDLHAYTLWANNTAYVVGDKRTDASNGSAWQCAVNHTSAAAGTFGTDRIAHPTFWTAITQLALGDPARKPIISAFEYASGNSVAKMFAAQADKLWDVSLQWSPVVVKSGQADGNYTASQLTNASGTNFLIAVNDAGDFPLRYDGTAWTTLNGGQITGPAGSTVIAGANLVHVWKYRNRWFFIEGGSMNAWCLPVNAVQGALIQIPLSGATKLGGRLMFGAVWSIDAGDGIDDKCIFVTDQGELLIFTGSDPSNSANWAQQGRYKIAPPMGKNAFFQIGGDLMIMTTEGIVPVSQAITKTAEQLDLAALTRTIKVTWRTEVAAKRGSPWTANKWDEFGGIFVALPGGTAGNRRCLVANAASGAWCRFTGWDATCWIRQRADLFFGTQDGIVMQGNRTGYDDGLPYVASLLGGWDVFQTGGAQATWRQARASFTAPQGQPFVPQLDAATDYQPNLPPPPPAGVDPGLQDAWDQGLWDVAKWDAPVSTVAPVRNTLWVSIGKTGYSHAQIVQVTVAQQAPPNVDLIAITALVEGAGFNV